jgi:hypothetical protein
LEWAYKLKPKTLGADKGYATGEFVHRLLEQTIDPHIPIMDTRAEHDKGIFPIEKFCYDTEQNRFICPQGKVLKYSKLQPHSKQHVYRASSKDCKPCPLKAQCTRSNYRSLSYHIYESSIEAARRLTKTRAYRISQRMRKRIEELFGEAKEFMGLRQAKFRRNVYVEEQVLLTAAAQNIKRIARLLSRRGPERETSTIAVIPSGLFEGAPLGDWSVFRSFTVRNVLLSFHGQLAWEQAVLSVAFQTTEFFNSLCKPDPISINDGSFVERILRR